MEGRLRKGLARRRVIAALARVPLFGLAIFIVALDLVFHAKAMLDWWVSRIGDRRLGGLPLRALTRQVITPMPLNGAGGRPGDATSA